MLLPHCRMERRNRQKKWLNEVGENRFSPLLESALLLKALLCLVFLSLAVLLCYNIYLACRCPLIEWREMANVTVIQSVREGTVQEVSALPENIYMYGLLQAVVLSWLPESVNLVLVNRLCSLLCLLLSSAVLTAAVCTALRLAGKQPLVPLTLLLLFIGSLLPHLFDCPSALGTPNYSGLLFSNLVLLCALRPSRVNVLLFPLLVTACMATKSYYLFSLVYIACSYLFLRKPPYRWAEALFVALVVGMVGWWYYSLPQSQYALIHHMLQRGDTDICRLPGRMACYLITVFSVLVLTVRGMRKYVCSLRRWNMPRMIKVLDGETPAVASFVGCVAVAAVVVVFRMGQHTGAFGILYFAQLLTPPLIAAAAYVLSVHPPRRTEICLSLAAVSVVCLLIAVGKTRKSYGHLLVQEAVVEQDFLRPWVNVRGSVLTSPVEWRIFHRATDNGLTEYADLIYRPDSSSAVRRTCEAYREKVAADIRHQAYDVIYTDLISYLNENRFPELKKYYDGTPLGSESNHFTRWVPRREK